MRTGEEDVTDSRSRPCNFSLRIGKRPRVLSRRSSKPTTYVLDEFRPVKQQSTTQFIDEERSTASKTPTATIHRQNTEKLVKRTSMTGYDPKPPRRRKSTKKKTSNHKKKNNLKRKEEQVMLENGMIPLPCVFGEAPFPKLLTSTEARHAEFNEGPVSLGGPSMYRLQFTDKPIEPRQQSEMIVLQCLAHSLMILVRALEFLLLSDTKKNAVRDIVERVKTLKWQWAGHIARRCADGWKTAMMDWIPRDLKRTRGRPPDRWDRDSKGSRCELEEHCTRSISLEGIRNNLCDAIFNAGMNGREEEEDPRGNPPTSGIFRHDSHMRKFRDHRGPQHADELPPPPPRTRIEIRSISAEEVGVRVRSTASACCRGHRVSLSSVTPLVEAVIRRTPSLRENRRDNGNESPSSGSAFLSSLERGRAAP
ncbi:hypothetical protein PR048_003040 [Dryococelus australis]|uniref:Uncharacterized protein n=1 Tax=Dryococelus australis TaxID=614101 RepID=A0ABQ9ILW4_9NEOP|nr:hypothetical protein PR048_003040 [Dryococelus australis]